MRREGRARRRIKNVVFRRFRRRSLATPADAAAAAAAALSSYRGALAASALASVTMATHKRKTAERRLSQSVYRQAGGERGASRRAQKCALCRQNDVLRGFFPVAVEVERIKVVACALKRSGGGTQSMRRCVLKT